MYIVPHRRALYGAIKMDITILSDEALGDLHRRITKELSYRKDKVNRIEEDV